MSRGISPRDRGTPGKTGVPSCFPAGRTAATLRLLMLGLFLLGGTDLRAQWLGDEASETLTRSGIDHLYNMQFDSAEAEFRRVISSHPDHPAGHFFLAAVEWWKILSDMENTSLDDHFVAMLDRVIELCDERLDTDEKDVAALFFKGGSLGFQGRLHGNRGDWVKAANSGRLALPIVQETYRLAPQNSDILFGIGIYNYFAAVIPEKYPFVKPLMMFFPEGDRAKGMEQLGRASRTAKYAGTEASYFLLQILFNFERQYERASVIADSLHARYPRNPLFHRYAGRCLAARGMWEEAGGTFTEVLDRVREGATGYSPIVEREARYYLGMTEMRGDNLSGALQQFYRCDELSRSLDAEKFSGFMTMANLKIGMIYDLQGKRELAVEQYDKVLDLEDYQGAHDQAEQYRNTPYRHN